MCIIFSDYILCLINKCFLLLLLLGFSNIAARFLRNLFFHRRAFRFHFQDTLFGIMSKGKSDWGEEDFCNSINKTKEVALCKQSISQYNPLLPWSLSFFFFYWATKYARPKISYLHYAFFVINIIVTKYERHKNMLSNHHDIIHHIMHMCIYYRIFILKDCIGIKKAPVLR